MKIPPTLRDEAEAEAYQYFDENIRELPKNSDGTINTSAPGFHDNDVDAFRHAYVSGVFTLAGFLDQIGSGEYPGYVVKDVRGKPTPVSKPDKRRTNNIG